MKKILFGLILVVLLIIVGRTLSLGISDCPLISNHKSVIPEGQAYGAGSNQSSVTDNGLPMTDHQLFLQALELLEEPVCSNLSLVSPVNDYFWLNQPILANSFISNSQKAKCNHGLHGFHRFLGSKEIKNNLCVHLCSSVVPKISFSPKRE